MPRRHCCHRSTPRRRLRWLSGAGRAVLCLAVWLVTTGALEPPDGWWRAGTQVDGYEIDHRPGEGRDGSAALYLRGDGTGEGSYAGVLQRVEAAPYRGERLRLSGWLRTREAAVGARLFVRLADGELERIVLDEMEDRPVRGTVGWTRVAAVVDVPEMAHELKIGVLLDGDGEVWADDLALQVVSREVAVTRQPQGPQVRPVEPRRSPNLGQFQEGWLLGGTRPEGFEITREPEGGRNGTPTVRFTAPSSAASRPETNRYGALVRYADPAEHRGLRLRLSAWIRTEDVEGHAALWMRVDGDAADRVLAFDNMDDRPIRGTTGWRRYEVVVDVLSRASAIFYGVILADGSGTVWVDDVELEEVGRDVPLTDLRRPSPRPRNLDFERPMVESPR